MKSAGRYIFACAIGVALAAIASILVTSLMPDRYRAETSLAIGDENSVLSAELGDQAQSVTNTVSQLIRSNAVALAVVNKLNLDLSADELLERIDVKQKPDAAVLAVTYEGDSKQQSVSVLKELNSVFGTQLAKVGADIKPPQRDANGDLQQPLKVKVRVFDDPHALSKKASPRPLFNLLVAILLGLMVAIFWTAFREGRSRDDDAPRERGLHTMDDEQDRGNDAKSIGKRTA